MRLALALILLAGCRGSSSAPAAGSGSAPPKPPDAAVSRALACAPAAAKVTLAVHDDQPAACWDTTCVSDGDRLDTRPTRPHAWLHPTEVRMDHGVLSVCKDGCAPLRNRLAEKLAKTDPANVQVSEDLEFVVADTTVWRRQLDSEMSLAVMPGHDASEVPSRVQIAGEVIVATYDGHGRIYNNGGLPMSSDLEGWDPGDLVQLAPRTFLVTDRQTPRFGMLDTAMGKLMWENASFAGFEIRDAIRVHADIASILMHDAEGWWIVTLTVSDRKIAALAHLPACR